MREFLLENSKNEIFHLDNVDSFLLSPEGLGFSRSMEFQRVGTSYKLVSESIEQHELSGTICFGGERYMTPYQQYAEFYRFLQHTPLIMHYLPDEQLETRYKIDVMPKEIQKTELETMGLNVNISFVALSLFYREVEVSGTYSVSMYCDSKIESPCILIFSGPISNPVTWTQEVDGTEVMFGKLNKAIDSGKELEVNTLANPYNITLIRHSPIYSTQSEYGNSDFNTKRFPLLQLGTNVFKCGAAADEIPITAYGRIYYATV